LLSRLETAGGPCGAASGGTGERSFRNPTRQPTQEECMPSQDLTVLVAVIEGLTKTCAELVVEVRALREALGTGITTALPALPAREADVAVGEPLPQVAEEPKPDRRRRAAAAAPRPRTKPDSPAVAWLEARGLRVIRFAPGNGDEKELLPLAVEMGDHLNDLRPLHDAIRDAQADGREFSISLRDRTGQAVSRCIQWATKLQERGLLQDVSYSRGNRTLSARTQAGGVAQSFFSGRWFELYLKAKIERILTARKLKFDTLMNACVRLPNGRSRELDLFFLINQEPIWIECKTGAYRDQRDRLRKLRTQMQVPPERSILAVLDVSPASAADRSKRWGLAVTGTDGVEDTILRALGLTQDDDTPQETEATVGETQGGKPATIESAATGQAAATTRADHSTPTKPAPAIPSGELERFLIRKLLRPQPEQRRAVLEGLLRVLAEGDGPATGDELIARLEPRFPDLTKANLTGIVRATLQGGGLLDNNGQPAKSLKTPIRKILPNVAELDARCRRAYAAAIIQADRDWFKDARNQAEFKTTVGGPAPSRGQLAQLRKHAADEIAKAEARQTGKAEAERAPEGRPEQKAKAADGKTTATAPEPIVAGQPRETAQPAGSGTAGPAGPRPNRPGQTTRPEPTPSAEPAPEQVVAAQPAQAPEYETARAARPASKKRPKSRPRQAAEPAPAQAAEVQPTPAAEAQPALAAEPEAPSTPETQQAAEPIPAQAAEPEPKKAAKSGSRRRPKPKSRQTPEPEAAPDAEHEPTPHAAPDPVAEHEPTPPPASEPPTEAETLPKKTAKAGSRKRPRPRTEEPAEAKPQAAPIVEFEDDPFADLEPKPAEEPQPKQATAGKPRQSSKSRSRRTPKTAPKQAPEPEVIQAAEAQPE